MTAAYMEENSSIIWPNYNKLLLVWRIKDDKDSGLFICPLLI